MDFQIVEASARYDGLNAVLRGENVACAEKKLAEVGAIFADVEACAAMPVDTVVYRVASHAKVAEGKDGGLFFGISCVMPGRVGDEYFMTKGHFHNRRCTAEYYWGLKGEGVLLLMDEKGCCRAEWVRPGTLHYIPGGIAHRLINTGNAPLEVGACWPSDAGHDYGSIADSGFPVRVVERDGRPAFVERG